MSPKAENLLLSVEVHKQCDGKRDARVELNIPISSILFIRTGKMADRKNSFQIVVSNYPNEGDAPHIYDGYGTFVDVCLRLRQLIAPESNNKQWIIYPYIFSPIGLKLVVRQDVIDGYVESNQENSLRIHNYDEPLPIITKQEQEDAQRAAAESFVSKGIQNMRKLAPIYEQIGRQWEAQQQGIRAYNQLKQEMQQMQQEMDELKAEQQAAKNKKCMGRHALFKWLRKLFT